MSITAVYDPKTQKARILKGQIHNGRPQRWTIAVKFKTDSGPHSITAKPKDACRLTELSDLIEQLILAEAAGEEIRGLTWTAISR